MRASFSPAFIETPSPRRFSQIGYTGAYHASWWYQDTAPGVGPGGEQKAKDIFRFFSFSWLLVPPWGVMHSFMRVAGRDFSRFDAVWAVRGF